MTAPEDRRGGTNGRPLADTLAETGPGIPDDAVVNGELAPGELGGEAVVAAKIAALVRAGWVSEGSESVGKEVLQARAEAETEAHPT